MGPPVVTLPHWEDQTNSPSNSAASSPRSQSFAINTPQLLLSKVRRGCNRVLYAFVPQYFRSTVFHKPGPSLRSSPTSWLDGLRGLAAVSIFGLHYLRAYMSTDEFGLGKDLPQLNIFKVLFSVRVDIFFIGSGFVLSSKVLAMMDTQEYDKIGINLSSAVFRRFGRLYLPAAAISLLDTLLAYIGAFEPARPYIEDPEWFPGWKHKKQIARMPSAIAQLQYWWENFSRMLNVFEWNIFGPPLHPHLWTIRVEYRSSILLFLTLLGLARVRQRIRMFLLVGVSLFCSCYGKWEVSFFLWGAIIAQAQIVFQGTSDKSPKSVMDDKSASLDLVPKKSRASIKALKGILYHGLVLFALHLMAQPKINYETAPGYAFLSWFVPDAFGSPRRFLPGVGSAILIATLTFMPSSSFYHRLLNTRPLRYLGRIMFSIYLIHGPVIYMFGWLIPHLVWYIVCGQEDIIRWVFGLFMGWLITLLIVLCLADVFEREVIGRCVKLTERIERFCFY